MINNLKEADVNTVIVEPTIEIPTSEYIHLIRAETERDILEAVIGSENRYQVEDVLKAIRSARSKWHVTIADGAVTEIHTKEDPDA